MNRKQSSNADVSPFLYKLMKESSTKANGERFSLLLRFFCTQCWATADQGKGSPRTDKGDAYQVVPLFIDPGRKKKSNGVLNLFPEGLRSTVKLKGNCYRNGKNSREDSLSYSVCELVNPGSKAIEFKEEDFLVTSTTAFVATDVDERYFLNDIQIGRVVPIVVSDNYFASLKPAALERMWSAAWLGYASGSAWWPTTEEEREILYGDLAA